jgi:hypothetical protein
MPAYAPGRVTIVNESAFSVLFKRRSTGDDGSAGPAQWLNLEAGIWENEFDAAAHARRLDPDADDPRERSFGVPIKVTDDPTAYALVHLEGDPKAVQVVYSANELYALTRGPSAKS